MRSRSTSILVLFQLAALLVPGVALAQSEARIVVEGRGRVDVAPDRARIVLAVETAAPEPEAAARDNAERQNRALAALREAGVDDDDLSTLGYGVQPNWQWRDGERFLDGYVARSTLRVETADLTTVGTLIDVALGAGVNQVDGISFELSDPEAARREALTRAVRNAHAAAAAMAEAAGGRLGHLIELATGERGAAPPVPMMSMARAYEAEQANDGTEVMAGEITVEVTVSGVWSFRGDGS